MKREKINWTVSVLLALLCLVFTLTAYTQEKKALTPDDYHLWKSANKIFAGQTSSDGSWYEYKIGNDTLINVVLKNIKNGLTHSFKINTTSNQYFKFRNNKKSNFSKDHKWYAIITNDTLNLLNLKSGKNEPFRGFTDFWFAGEGRYVIGVDDKSKVKRLWLRDLKTQSVKTIERVQEFSINNDYSKLIVIVDEDGVRKAKSVLLTSGLPMSLIAATKNNFSTLTWNTPGNTAIFYEFEAHPHTSKMLKIYAYSKFGANQKIKVLDSLTQGDWPKGYKITPLEPLISDDGKQVFTSFMRSDFEANKTISKKKDSIEIWYPNDLTLPAETGYGMERFKLRYSWNLNDGKLRPITDYTNYRSVLTGDAKAALIYHKDGYLPQHKYVNQFVDFYIKDIETGDAKLLIKKVMDQPSQLLVSPGGKYITYFKEKNWWVYDIKTDSHTCITEGLGIDFEDHEGSLTGTVPNYGQPGWFENDSEVIIYDQFDIWVISPDGQQKRRITNGRETNRTYRFEKRSGFWFNSRSFAGNKELLIYSVNNENLDNGLFIWSRKNGMVKLIEKAMKLTVLSDVKPDHAFLIEVSSFNVYPRLILYHPSGKTELLYETNPQQNDYKWGKSELVHYTTQDGKRLKAALFYPADYVPGKQYPMVVYIYEKLSQHLHNYVNPESDGSSMNVANYTTDGYFVLYPDISYELNNPGISATKCVVAAVEKVIGMGMVDKRNIGLMGHSFGGYQTAFIVTQTSLFKTAIPSAGITDLPTFSLQISSFGPNFTRVEQDQFRMNSTFLGEDYRRNSPMHYVHQVNIPILLWTGDSDVNVDPNQTKSFHNALWRLGKQSTMILYAGEDHVLRKPENKSDIVRRAKNWFDYYLKGEKPTEWIAKGISNSNSAK